MGEEPIYHLNLLLANRVLMANWTLVPIVKNHAWLLWLVAVNLWYHFWKMDSEMRAGEHRCAVKSCTWNATSFFLPSASCCSGLFSFCCSRFDASCTTPAGVLSCTVFIVFFLKIYCVHPDHHKRTELSKKEKAVIQFQLLVSSWSY